MDGDPRDETVVAHGGPLDGRELAIGDGATELVVLMADGSRHRYLRTVQRRPADGGVLRVVLRWDGRT